MKKALLISLGHSQIDAIKYLKNAGWWVIGCGHKKEGEAPEVVDQFELIDIKDFSALEELGRREKVDLVYSVGSDLAMPAVATVAHGLGLPCFISAETAQLMQNKIMLRDFCATHDISPVKYRKVTSEADIEGWNHFPAIVKPVDSQGQRGVFRADFLDEIKAGLNNSLHSSMSGTVIIEELLDGPEVSANVFIINREVVLNEISDRLVLKGHSGGIPRGHVLPTKKCTRETLIETKALVENCCKKFGIENGPVYFQMKLTRNGPRIIEITPRLDGCHIWRLIKTVGGVDLIAASFRLLADDKSIKLQMQPNKDTCEIRFFLCPPGQVFKKTDYDVPAGALYTEYRYKNGEIVRAVNGFMEVVGYYIAKER
jgi:biotin carboxylase